MKKIRKESCLVFESAPKLLFDLKDKTYCFLCTQKVSTIKNGPMCPVGRLHDNPPKDIPNELKFYT
jgi:hypothetical protein